MSSSTSSEDTSVLLSRIAGLTTAINTPLTAAGDLDLAGLERLIDRVIEAGSSCIFPLGWNGEGPLLRDQLRMNVIRQTCHIVRGRVPVMVGVSEQSLPRALEMIAVARSAGASLVLSTPPYSYAIPQELIYEYFRSLAAEAGLPVVIYDNGEVGVRPNFETLTRLSSTPRILGVKSYAPWQEMQRQFQTIHVPGRFAVMSGDEYFYGPALCIGVSHFTMGGPGNVCPRWCTRMHQAALARKWDQVLSMHLRLTAFCDELYKDVETPYAAIKYALEVLGICSAFISSPHRMPEVHHRERIRAALSNFKDVVNG
ncbi:MAG TPA: dihydrodipicolinate synthase family protein [Candidatus Dormibacteraeota bacterium]|nr:dihydrodipicolinate synthase family protein [Candidatus Dormibacteraeota bacterium]